MALARRNLLATTEQTSSLATYEGFTQSDTTNTAAMGIACARDIPALSMWHRGSSTGRSSAVQL